MFDIGVVGDNHSALTRCHVLSWVEGEGSSDSPLTGHSTVKGGKVRLGCIFKNNEVVLLADLFEAIHICNMAVEMHGHDCLGAWSN